MFSNSNGGFKKTLIKVQERTLIYNTEPNNISICIHNDFIQINLQKQNQLICQSVAY